MKLVCLGDSLTVGPEVDAEKRWTVRLAKDSGHRVINAGISGDTTSGMLARLYQDVITERPDYALIIGGTNDLISAGRSSAGSEAAGALTIIQNNFMAIVHHLFHAGIRPIVASPIPCDPAMIPSGWREFYDFGSLNDRLSALHDWCAGFAKSFYCGCLDLYKPFAQELETHSAEELFLDGLHLTEQGHALLATIIHRQLKDFLG